MPERKRAPPPAARPPLSGRKPAPAPTPGPGPAPTPTPPAERDLTTVDPASLTHPDVARFPAGPKVRAWAQEHGFSDWMVARLVRLVDDPKPLLEGLRRRPPRYLRVNPIRGRVDDVKERLEARGFAFSRSDLDPNVLRIREAPISPGATLEHMLGMTSPQDLASASAPLALEARPGDVVADLAAAPGIKTVHVAGDLVEDRRQRGAIVAVEPDAERMRALRFNLERSGVASAILRLGTAQELPGTAWADKVLLDAPCTGEGTIPKDRNRRFARPGEIAQLAALQREIVDAADRILKPGGTLVYATCTFAPEENEAQVQRLLDRGYRIEALPFDRCGNVPLVPAVTEWPGIHLDASIAKARRFLPGLHPTLGFFVAKLTKRVRA